MATTRTWKTKSLANHPASLPKCNIPDSVDHEAVAANAVQRLSQVDANELADNAIWRDSLAFTGTFRTFFGPGQIVQEWEYLSREHEPTDFQVVDGSSTVLRLGPETCWVQASFSFYTNGSGVDRCSGTIGVFPVEGSWKVWLVCTVLEQPSGFPDVDRLEPGPNTMPKHLHFENGTQDPLTEQRSNGASDDRSDSVDCLVVGAGIGGLTMAGRLKALGLSYVLVDRYDSVGDVWSKGRYESIKLHTSKQFNQLPGMPPIFDDNYPYLLNAKHLSEGFQSYVARFGINVVTSTSFETAQYEDENKIWNTRLRRKGQEIRIKARHIVLAVGDMGVRPQMPEYSHRQSFQGDVIHAVDWKNARPWRGKSGIVIGSANTAHDIIADMAQQDFKSITLIQRSETFVLPLSFFSALVDPLYNENIPIEISDRAFLSLPLSIQRLETMVGIRAMADLNPTAFDELAARGFRTRRYGDLWGQLYESHGKHFFDVGAGDLIRDGTVKVRSDALPVAYTVSGLLLDDGSHIDADVIAFATGYSSNFQFMTKQIFGEDVAARLRPFWGTDAEGEILGAWKPTGHHGIWYTGHGFGHARYYSRFVAMQIKADVLGRPFKVYEAD